MIIGLTCLVIGAAEGVADDFAAYLAHAKAAVERVADLVAARDWLDARKSGLAVLVIDSGTAGPALDELCSAARTHRQQQIRFVVVGREGSRGRRPSDTALVILDDNLLTHSVLLKAVAAAAGRAQELPLESLPRHSRADSGVLSAPIAVDRLNRRILVAEDYEINQKMILRQLALLGFEADVMGNGHDALECWCCCDYAMLLTDLHMPEMDGFALTATIRREEDPDHRLPIVVITANALKEVEVLCKQVGVDDYLSKPVLLYPLKAMPEKWLSPAGADFSTSENLTSPINPQLALLDTTALAQLVGDNPSLIAELIEDFRHSAQNTARDIRGALMLGDWKKAGDGAHKLKSSSRSVGAMILAHACTQLEKACVNADSTVMPSLSNDFESALAEVLVVIN